MATTPTIFISHASSDNYAALEVLLTLHALEYDDVFIDIDPAGGLIGGVPFVSSLSTAHRESSIVIPLISSAWLASSWCVAELRAALLAKKLALPILIDGTAIGTLPAEIASLQIIDWGKPASGSLLKRALSEHSSGKRYSMRKKGGRRAKAATSDHPVMFLKRARQGFLSSGHDVSDIALPSHGLFTFIATKRLLGPISTKIGVSCWPNSYQTLHASHLATVQRQLNYWHQFFALDRVALIHEQPPSSGLRTLQSASHYIDLMSLEQLEANALGTSEYLKGCRRLYKSYVSETYVDLDIRETDPGSKKTVELMDISHHISESLVSDKVKFYFLLGDFGSGKTTIAENCHGEISDLYGAGKTDLFPMIFYLRTFAQFENELKFIEMQTRSSSPNAQPDLFLAMCKRGRVLCVLDGFDEIATNSTARDRFIFFSRVLNLAHRSSNVLLTSRPAVFNNFTELNDLVARAIDVTVKRPHQFKQRTRRVDEDRDLAARKNAELLKARMLGAPHKKFPAAQSRLGTIQPLTPEKVIAFFRPHKDVLFSRHKKTPEQIYNVLKDVYDLSEIITRPLLIDMFIFVLINGEIDLNDPDLLVGPVSLYQNYINLHLDRENLKSQFLGPQARLGFARAAAKAMLNSGGSLEATLEGIASVVRATSEIHRDLGDGVLENQLEQVITDVRTCGFVNITPEDRIAFSHKSFMEFFVADLIYEKISAGGYAEELDVPLNYEILYFLGGFGLLRQDFRFALSQHLSRIGRSVSPRYRTNLEIAKLFSERNPAERKFSNIEFDGIKITKKVFSDCSFEHMSLSNAQVSLVGMDKCRFGGLGISGELIKECDGRLSLPQSGSEIRITNSTLVIDGLESISSSSVVRSDLSLLAQRSVMHGGNLEACSISCPQAQEVEWRDVKVEHVVLIGPFACPERDGIESSVAQSGFASLDLTDSQYKDLALIGWLVSIRQWQKDASFFFQLHRSDDCRRYQGGA